MKEWEVVGKQSEMVGEGKDLQNGKKVWGGAWVWRFLKDHIWPLSLRFPIPAIVQGQSKYLARESIFSL